MLLQEIRNALKSTFRQTPKSSLRKNDALETYKELIPVTAPSFDNSTFDTINPLGTWQRHAERPALGRATKDAVRWSDEHARTLWFALYETSPCVSQSVSYRSRRTSLSQTVRIDR